MCKRFIQSGMYHCAGESTKDKELAKENNSHYGKNIKKFAIILKTQTCS